MVTTSANELPMKLSGWEMQALGIPKVFSKKRAVRELKPLTPGNRHIELLHFQFVIFLPPHCQYLMVNTNYTENFYIFIFYFFY